MPRWILGLMLFVAAPAIAQEATPDTTAAPTADEMVTMMEAQCAESAEARTARHAETPLFERLGGSEGVHAITREVVRLHMENPALNYRFAELDTAKVAQRVAEFIISGTGGPAVYEGPDLNTSHKAMKLTNEDFMAAGGDVIQAMKNLGVGENEINEVVCTLVSLRDQVVLPEETAPAKK